MVIVKPMIFFRLFSLSVDPKSLWNRLEHKAGLIDASTHPKHPFLQDVQTCRILPRNRVKPDRRGPAKLDRAKVQDAAQHDGGASTKARLRKKKARRKAGFRIGFFIQCSKMAFRWEFRHELHAPSFGFLVERRQPFAAFLLPNRRGENFPRLFFAFAGCILRRRVGHDDRAFIEPPIGEIGKREVVDHTSRVSNASQNLLLPLEYPSIGDAYGVGRGPRFHWFCIVVFPRSPGSFFVTFECLLYGCIHLREQWDYG